MKLLRRIVRATYSAPPHREADGTFSKAGIGRSGRIRTCDPLLPKQVRYQAALHSAGESARVLFDLGLGVKRKRGGKSRRTGQSVHKRLRPLAKYVRPMFTPNHYPLSAHTVSAPAPARKARCIRTLPRVRRVTSRLEIIGATGDIPADSGQGKSSMTDLIDQIAASTGVDRDATEKTIGIIASFLRGQAPATTAAAVLDKLPEVAALADRQGKIFGGMFGAFNAISGVGLGMGEVQAVARAFQKFAKERAGEKEVDDLLASVPALNQFL